LPQPGWRRPAQRRSPRKSQKKCDALVAREFPLREPGNPAAGSAKGTAQAERDFFNQCVANNGTMNGPADNNAPPDKAVK